MDLATINQQIEKVHKEFEAYKEQNDKALAQAAEKGHVDSLIKEAQEKAEASMKQVTEKLDNLVAEKEALEAAVKRGFAQSKGGEDPEIKAKSFGKMIGQPDMDAKGLEEYTEAFFKYARQGDNGSEKALQVGRDPQGGFWVPPDISGRIVQHVYETSPMRQVASVQTIGTDALEGPYDLGEADAGWVGETQDRSITSTPDLGEWRIPVHEQYAMPKITQKQLDDSEMDMEQWIENKVRRKLTRKENQAFVKGNGIKRPRGFLTYPEGTPSASDFEKIAVKKTGVDGDWATSHPGDILIQTTYDLEDEFIPNAVFAMKRSLEGEIRQMKDGNDNYLWQPDFSQRNGRSLLGHNIVNMQDMPAKASNSLSIAFGDFTEAYQIVDRLGIRMLRDPYTAKPWILLYTTRRVGGGVVNFQALRLIKFATT